MDWLVSAQRWLYGGMADSIGGAKTGGDVAALIGLAVLFGALHALMPGHGKSLLVSYHLGRDGRWRDGLRTASLLAASHIGMAVLLVLAGMAAVGGVFATRDDGAGFETASAAMIVAIGLYLLFRALRPTARRTQGDGNLLALAAGVAPCPLTVFILSFAILHDKVAIGLVAVVAMLLGVVATLAACAIAALATRGRLLDWLERHATLHARVGSGLEIAGAVGVLAIGTAMLAMRAGLP